MDWVKCDASTICISLIFAARWNGLGGNGRTNFEKIIALEKSKTVIGWVERQEGGRTLTLFGGGGLDFPCDFPQSIGPAIGPTMMV